MNTTLIKKISLADFALPQDYQVKPLTYSGIQGKADVMGCYIVVFRTIEKPEETAAISFDDMLEDRFTQTVGNDILRYLNMQIQFGDSSENVKKIYGEPFAINKRSEEVTQLYYLVNNNTLLNLGLNEKHGLYSLEITNNANIVKKRKQRLLAYHAL